MSSINVELPAFESLLTLPNDISETVMTYLSVRGLCNLGATCRALSMITSREFEKRDAYMDPSLASDASTCRERVVRRMLASETARSMELLADCHHSHGSSKPLCLHCTSFPNLNIDALAPAHSNRYEYFLRISDLWCEDQTLWQGFVPCRQTSGMTDYTGEPGYADIQELNTFLTNCHLFELNLDLRCTSIFQEIQWEPRPFWRAQGDMVQEIRVTVVALRRFCNKHQQSLVVTTGGFQNSRGSPPSPSCWILMERQVSSHATEYNTTRPHVAPVFFVNWSDHRVESLSLYYSGGAEDLEDSAMDRVVHEMNPGTLSFLSTDRMQDMDWNDLDDTDEFWGFEDDVDGFEEMDDDDADSFGLMLCATTATSTGRQME